MSKHSASQEIIQCYGTECTVLTCHRLFTNHVRADWSRGVVHQGGVIVYRGEPRGVGPRGGIPRAIPGVELEQSVKSRSQRGAQGWSPGVEPTAQGWCSPL